MKKSFILHIDSLDILDDLTDEEAGRLIKAIHNHQKGIENNLDPLIKMAFIPFKNQFVRDDEKYSQFVDKQSENGAKGGRPKNPNKPKKPKPLNKNPKNPSEPKKAYNVSDSVNDSNNVNDNDSKSENKNETENISSSAKAEAATRKVSEKLYPRMVGVYDSFCKEFTGGGSKMDGGEGKAMNEIIAYLDKNVTDKNGDRDEEVMAAWTYIFQHWRDLDAFTQKSITLKKINSNIQSILAQLKNGKLTGKTETKSEAATRANNDLRTKIMSGEIRND